MIAPHFYHQHDQCDAESSCREPGYIPNYDIVTNPIATKLLTDFIKRLVICKKPSDYVYVRDTFLVESFNNVALIYLDRRIHYRDETYTGRRNVVVLAWNEHVSRPYASSSNWQTVRHQVRESEPPISSDQVWLPWHRPSTLTAG